MALAYVSWGSVLDGYSYSYHPGEGTDSIQAKDNTIISNEDDVSMPDYSINDGVSSVTPEMEEMPSIQGETCFGAVSKVNSNDTPTNVT